MRKYLKESNIRDKEFTLVYEFRSLVHSCLVLHAWEELYGRVCGQEDLFSSYGQEAEAQRDQRHDGFRGQPLGLYPLARSHLQKFLEYFEIESSDSGLGYNTEDYGRLFIFNHTNYYLKMWFIYLSLFL